MGPHRGWKLKLSLGALVALVGMAQGRCAFAGPAGCWVNSAAAGGAGAPPSCEDTAGHWLDGIRQCLHDSDVTCADKGLAKIDDASVKRSPAYLELKTQTLFLQHKKAEAFATIDAALSQAPGEACFYIVKGLLYQKSGDQVSAMQSFLRARDLDRRLPAPFFHVGMSFFILGFASGTPEYYDRAERNFKAALQLDPNYDKAEFMLGQTEAVNSHFSEAKTDFSKALQLSPQNPYYHLYDGILLKQIGDEDGALREMREAEKLDSALGLAYYNLGRLYFQMGKREEAQKQLETAVRLDPSSAAYNALGAVYHSLGLNDQSKAAYEQFELAKKRETQQDPTQALILNSGAGAAAPQ